MTLFIIKQALKLTIWHLTKNGFVLTIPKAHVDLIFTRWHAWWTEIVGWLRLFKLVHLVLQRKCLSCHSVCYLKVKLLLIKLTVRVVTATDVGSDRAPPHPSPQPHVNKRTCGGKAGSVFEQTPHPWFQTSTLSLVTCSRRCCHRFYCTVTVVPMLWWNSNKRRVNVQRSYFWTALLTHRCFCFVSFEQRG